MSMRMKGYPQVAGVGVWDIIHMLVTLHGEKKKNDKPIANNLNGEKLKRLNKAAHIHKRPQTIYQRMPTPKVINTYSKMTE